MLNNKEVRNNKLIKLITELKDTYGDARRTKLINTEIPKQEKEQVVIEPEDCVVIISSKGTVKESQKRFLNLKKEILLE